MGGSLQREPYLKAFLFKKNMILISVKSEFVTDKRQFKSDRSAMRFLKQIERLHESHRIAIIGKKPKKLEFKVKKIIRRGKTKTIVDMERFNKAISDWNFLLRYTLKLKVEIINTKQNQLLSTLK